MDIFIIFMAYIALTKAQSCIVDNFAVQDNFDINKWAGKWYEISWVKYYFEPSTDNYLDFVQNYTIINSTYAEAINAGRISTDADECVVEQVKFLVSSANPAKWSFVKTVDDTAKDLDHWIINTDYDNYAFVYGCTTKNVDGTCKNAHAWKWGRTPQISADYLTKVDEGVTATCMDAYTFVSSDQDQDCKLTTSGASIASYGSLILAFAFWWQIM